MKKYEKKLDKLRAKMQSAGTYTNEDDLHIEMQNRYGKKSWMWVADKNLSKNGEGFDYYNAGDLYRYYDALKKQNSSPQSQEIGLTIVDQSAVNTSNKTGVWGGGNGGFYWVFSIPNADKFSGNVQVQFTINNQISDPLTTQLFNGANRVIGSLNSTFITQQEVPANTNGSSGYISVNIDKSSGIITVQAFYACSYKTVQNKDGTYTNAPDCVSASGSLGVTPPISATAIVPVIKPVLRNPMPFTARQSGNTTGEMNRRPDRLNSKTLYDLQFVWFPYMNLRTR